MAQRRLAARTAERVWTPDLASGGAAAILAIVNIVFFFACFFYLLQQACKGLAQCRVDFMLLLSVSLGPPRPVTGGAARPGRPVVPAVVAPANQTSPRGLSWRCLRTQNKFSSGSVAVPPAGAPLTSEPSRRARCSVRCAAAAAAASGARCLLFKHIYVRLYLVFKQIYSIIAGALVNAAVAALCRCAAAAARRRPTAGAASAHSAASLSKMVFSP
jgi:hypothetical protein